MVGDAKAAVVGATWPRCLCSCWEGRLVLLSVSFSAALRKALENFGPAVPSSDIQVMSTASFHILAIEDLRDA